MRIALSGGQGIGKTTLATSISDLYNIPFIKADTSSFMPNGVKSHKDILELSIKSPQSGVDFQSNIIDARYNLFKNTKGCFISDRAVIDSYAYYSMHNSMFDTSENSDILLTKSIESLKYLDFIVCFNQLHQPYRESSKDNGVRFTNKAYLKQVNGAIKYTYLELLNVILEIDESSIYEYNGKEINGMDINFRHIKEFDVFLCIFTEKYYNNEVNRATYLYENLKLMYDRKPFIGSPIETLDEKTAVRN